MKKYVILLLVVVSSTGYAQLSKKPISNGTSKTIIEDHQINHFIREVYLDQADDLFFKNQERLKAIKRFLNKVEIKYRKNISLNKKYPNTLDLPLNNEYNKSLTYDTGVSNPNAFNPLKYKVEKFSRERKTYRIGNTYYLLVINPQD